MSKTPVRIDAHQHFWQLDRGDYRWLTPELGPLYRDFQPADLQPELQAHGIRHTILVQAADSLAETEYLLALADRTPFVAGVVGWVDLAAPAAARDLARLCRHRKLVGIRPMLQDLPEDDWMLRRDLDAAYRAVIEHGLVFDALVKPRHLPHLIRLVDIYPELRVVIDHAAKLPILPLDQTWSQLPRWRRDLTTLAGNPNVACKLSGLVTEAHPAWTAAELRPVAESVLELFTPARVLWGSDWPVVLRNGSYARWWDATQELLQGLRPADRDAILGGNAARVYLSGDRVS